MAVGETRPGYELWRPNREKAQSKTTKFIVIILLLASAAVAAVVTIAGFDLLEGGVGMGIVCAIYVILYVGFAFLILRWSRGVLPVAAAIATLLLIFCAIGAQSWFSRDKDGFDEALLPEPLLGLLLLILIPLQVLLIAVSLIAFNQEWQVEEERPIGSGEDYGAGAGPSHGEHSPQPA